ncbi:hypothetical protein EVJ58_g4736 [Rhodofomes roseus]|uniref:HAUS augmin-like complex subunit 6 N-terminal domain-containing protein n=1 Tax=Rhodofomes roseus TaxID=34475 RepID=A0A4Y9YGU3_9APHY|nr:hypothetical protein EVJ58_g4736 [Rhodofomes roseus]
MEDISYFLVAKVEGGKGRARSFLSTYPCLQPADTTAFRISLAKYLETLRHSSLFPSHAEDRQKSKDDTKVKHADTPQRHAWWWQDVVVRKSLLEECSDRLVALRDSRLHDLLRATWKNADGRRALHFLVDLAGLQTSPATRDASRPLQTADVGQDKADVQCTLPTPVTVPPLPIAAANHPTNVRSLKAPLFSPPTKSLSANPPVSEANTHSAQDPTKDRLSERLASIQRTHQALLDVALRIDNVRQDLERRSRSAQPAHAVPALGTGSSLNLGIWEAPSRMHIDFRAPSEVPSSSTLGPSADTVVEERIARIRTALLPKYPEAPSHSDLDLDEPATSSVSIATTSASRLLQPSGKGHWRSQGSKGSGYDVKANRYQPAKAADLAVHDRDPKISGEMKEPRALDVDTGARKVSTKLSRRASAARARRTTLLARRNLYDDEVDEIVEAVEDGSPPFADNVQTPKARQGTAGTLLSTIKKTIPRPSFDIERHERAIDVPLPKLRLSALDTHDLHAEISPKEDVVRRFPVPAQDEHSGEEDEFYEGNSVTLRDILLKATDANGDQYDLLGDEEDDLGDEAFEW